MVLTSHEEVSLWRTLNAKRGSTNLSQISERVTIFRQKEHFKLSHKFPEQYFIVEASCHLYQRTAVIALERPPELQSPASRNLKALQKLMHHGIQLSRQVLISRFSYLVAQDWGEADANTVANRIIRRQHTSIRSSTFDTLHCITLLKSCRFALCPVNTRHVVIQDTV